MCGSEAVPTIMQNTRVTNFHAAIAPSGGVACSVVSALRAPTVSVGAVPTPMIGSSSMMRWTAAPYSRCGSQPKPCAIDIQKIGIR